MDRYKKVIVYIFFIMCISLSITLGYCEGNEAAAKKVDVDFKFVLDRPSSDCENMVAMDNNKELYVEKTVQLSIEDMASAKVVIFDDIKVPKNKDNRKSLILNKSTVDIKPQINIYFNFTEQGSQKLAKLTSENIGRRLGIVINGKLIMAPVILESIAGGTVQLSGNFTEEYANDIARAVNLVISSRQQHN